MNRPDDSELLSVLRAASEREREAREQLIRARDELQARDERFAVLEADLWAGCEERERSARGEIARHERAQAALREEVARHRTETALLRDELIRLRVRLDRIVGSPPFRVYTRLQQLPGLKAVRGRRTRAYETALRARLRG
ncbi:MAG: hypothetical protein WAK93_03605 [Solirubrobacteraceae bacterium]